MEEFIARIQELCDEHNIQMPEDVLELSAYDFGVDRYEVTQLFQEIHNLRNEYCDISE